MEICREQDKFLTNREVSARSSDNMCRSFSVHKKMKRRKIYQFDLIVGVKMEFIQNNKTVQWPWIAQLSPESWEANVYHKI